MKATLFLLLTLGMLYLFSDPVKEPQTTISNVSVQKSWTKADSKAYARDRLSEWQDEQWSCLSKLWGKESAWNPKAYNTIRVMGKNAGGIPQLLGLDPDTPAPRQIERGLAYIYYRYDTPCKAWAFFKENNWH
jgi:hypothetical protein